MAKKRNNAKSNAVVVQVQSQPQSKPKKKTRRSRKSVQRVAAPTWYSLVRDPFSRTPVHIPDQVTTPSGIVSTRYYTRTAFPAATGTSTGHSGGYVILPHLNCGMFGLSETSAGNGTLTDLNSAGTAQPITVNWPNYSSALTPDAKARCIAMGIRVTYEGTELNRSGRFVAGTIPIGGAAFSVASTGTALSVLSTLVHGVTASIGTLRNSMSNVTECRVSDGVFTATWTPNGVPYYQASSNQPLDTLPTTGSGITHVFDSLYSASAGSAGCEAGQNAFVFFLEGDTTSAASGSANTYAFEVTSHWEVVPSDPTAVSYPITPSYSDPIALAESLNKICSSPTGYVSSSAQFANSAQAGGSNFDMSSMYNSLPSSSQVMSAARMGAKLAQYFAKNSAAQRAIMPA